MHVLLIHQAFVSLDEPGGTRHHELARYLANQGHRVTIIASPISYLTGKSLREKISWSDKQMDGEQPHRHNASESTLIEVASVR